MCGEFWRELSEFEVFECNDEDREKDKVVWTQDVLCGRGSILHIGHLERYST